MNINLILRALTSEEKDSLFRALWSEHVAADVKSFAESIDVNLSESQIKEAADRYVNGEYDCNQDYWTNLETIVDSFDNNIASNNTKSKEDSNFTNWAYNWYKLNWGVKRNLLPEDVHDETSVNGESPLSTGDFIANVLSDEAAKKGYEELYVLLSILSWIDSEYTHREFLEFCEKELSMTPDEMNTYTDNNLMSLTAMKNVLCADSNKQASRVQEMLKITLDWLIEAADLHYNNFYKVFVVDMGLPQKIIQEYVDIPELQSRREYSTRLASLENRCEEIGAEPPSFWFYDHEHLNRIWYLPDVVASVCYKGCLIEVCVRGITEASLNGSRISNDGNKALIQDGNVLSALKNDAVIDALKDSKELVFYAQPWIEVSIFNSSGVCIKTSIPNENCDVLSALERYFNDSIRFIDNYMLTRRTL